MLNSFGKGNPGSDALMDAIMQTSTSVMGEAAILGLTKGMNPRLFLAGVIADLIPHVYEAQKLTSEAQAKDWLELLFEATQGHFEVHGVNIRLGICHRDVPAPDDELTLEEKALVAAKKIIVAIQLVRERTGMGLKEAKQLVEQNRPTRFCATCDGKGRVNA